MGFTLTHSPSTWSHQGNTLTVESPVLKNVWILIPLMAIPALAFMGAMVLAVILSGALLLAMMFHVIIDKPFHRIVINARGLLIHRYFYKVTVPMDDLEYFKIVSERHLGGDKSSGREFLSAVTTEGREIFLMATPTTDDETYGRLDFYDNLKLFKDVLVLEDSRAKVRA